MDALTDLLQASGMHTDASHRAENGKGCAFPSHQKHIDERTRLAPMSGITT
jgi:hypothetical protein